MTSSGEQLGDACRVEASLCQTEGSSKTSTPSTAVKHVSRSIWSHGSRVHETHTTIASYSCSIKGYLPLSQDYVIGIELRYPLRWAVSRRIDHTFTAWALVGPVPTKRREGVELLKFLFTDFKAPGRVFLNIIGHPVGSGGAARGKLVAEEECSGLVVWRSSSSCAPAPVRVAPANSITCIKNPNVGRQH